WQWHTRQLQPLLAAQPDKLMFLSAPVQKRVLIQAAPAAAAAPGAAVARTTVAHQLRTSIVPPVAVSAQMRQILRPRGRAVRKLAFGDRSMAPQGLITRLNAREIIPAPIKQTPPALQAETVLADQVQPSPQPQWLVD